MISLVKSKNIGINESRKSPEYLWIGNIVSKQKLILPENFDKYNNEMKKKCKQVDCRARSSAVRAVDS